MMDLLNKIQSLQESTNNVILKNTAKSYINSMKASNSVDEIGMAKNFLAQVGEILDLSESERKEILNTFKIYDVAKLGVYEGISTILEDSEFVVDPIYEDRINYLKQLSEDNKNSEYKIIEKVLETLKTFPSEDLVVKEICESLQGVVESRDDEIRVLNFVDYVKTSPDYKKYKASCKEVLKKVDEYLMEGNAHTRTNLIEALRTVPQNAEIKTFSNYLAAKMFSDDSYHSGLDLGSKSMASGRLKTAYFNNIGKPASKQGLGTIVYESFSEAEKMLDELPRRNVINLLVENLKTLELNKTEKRLFDNLVKEKNITDLGILESLTKLQKSPLYPTPEIKLLVETVKSKIQNEDVADYKIVFEFLNRIQKYTYDTIFESVYNTIFENYKKSEETILITTFLDNTEKTNKLGLYEGIRKDLITYLNEPTPVSKRAILENYRRFFFEAPIMEFLNNFEKVNQLNETKAFIFNSNPNEYVVEKVYSFFEKDGLKEHFIINGKNFIRKGDELLVVNENKISPRVKMLTESFNSLGLKVISESKISGQYNGHKLSIDSDESGDYLSINETQYQNIQKDYLKMNFPIIFKGDTPKMFEFYTIFENLNSFVEVDYINKVTYRKNPAINCYIFKLNETFVVQLVNENIKFEKFVKSKNPKTIKNVIFEFMNFDVSKSIDELMDSQDKKIQAITESANNKLSKIKAYENTISSLKDKLKGMKDSYLKSEIQSVLESIEEEVEGIRDAYAEDVEALDSFDTPETMLSVGDKVKCLINDQFGSIISLVGGSKCLIQFEDGTQSECYCSDLEKLEDSSVEISGPTDGIAAVPEYDPETEQIVEPEVETTVEEIEEMPEVVSRTMGEGDEDEEEYTDEDESKVSTHRTYPANDMDMFTKKRFKKKVQ